MITQQTSLDGALWLASRGFEVFPADHPGLAQCAGVGRSHDAATCTDRGKHPAVPFSKVHTRDERQAFRWFDGQLRNVGVFVGACTGPDDARLLVVDSDRPGAIEDTAAAHGQAHTPTMRVRTAKGTHDYYWTPAGTTLGNGLGSLRGKFDGDVRAGNAYVVSIGSVHATGVIYELEDPDQPPEFAPEWLLAALQQPVQQPRHTATPLQPRQAGGRLVGLLRFVLSSSHGDRNNRLYWAACRAFECADEADFAGRDVASALLDAALGVGLSEGEARQTITSAYRTGNAR
ncbi:bifunctional DNA primase/polymerase [Streptomyces sp. NPDC002685]|uniref:bifunctional DNA primase/polymerase n=1 Tax=Streptomyces sp. NPDC002685 TaxID=3154540 RepID=UPI00332F05E7